MLTIEDLNRIINLPSVSLDINENQVKNVISFRDEAIPFVDNLNIFTIDFVNNLNEILSYWYMLQNNPWIKGKCVVGIMGAYNAGKSTLLNYLLGTTLPTGVNPVTAVSTYITQGDENLHYIVDNAGNLKVVPEDLESRLSHEETKGFNLRKIISHTVLYNKSSFLKNVSFLDTPGISADNEYDYETTADAAGKCDIVIWAIRANAGAITQFEIDFIQRYIAGKKLYVVITHADRVPNPDKIKQVILKQLSDAEISCMDVFFFGKRTTKLLNVDEQMNFVSSALNNEISQFRAFQPQEQLNNYLSIIQEKIDENIKLLTEEKQRIEKICREYEHHIEDVKQSLNNNTESLRRSVNSVRSTIDNRCHGVLMCTGGAYGQLVGCCNSLIDCYNNLIDCISEIDIEQVVTYGKAVSYLSRISDNLDSSISSRNKCVELISKSNNLLK